MLRSYLGGLITLGLPRRWARNVLNLQTTVLVAISATLSLVIGVIPIVIAALPDLPSSPSEIRSAGH